jgi:hypothetical protein
MSANNDWTTLEVDQLRRGATLTPKQRLDWLWQVKLLAANAREAAAERRAGESK